MQLTGVGVRYGRRAPWVLREVDLYLAPGTLAEVTGRNGSGKSSLLRVLAGVLMPGTGAVHRRPAVVGWVPERFPSTQPFTAGHYLLHQAHLRGLAPTKARAAVAREAERLKLTSLLTTPLDELSKGSAQKVGLAQALLVRPGLLVLDEPWSGLDAGARSAVPVIVRDVLDDGGRVVVTDHQQLAAALSPSVRWHVEDGAVSVQEPDGARVVTVEVDVPVDDVAALLRALTGYGLSPRVR